MDTHLFDLNAKLEQTHWWYTARARIIRILAETMIPEGSLVLEVGCGTGGILAALPRHWRRIGIDPSRKAIELGRVLYPDLDLRLGTAPQDVETELEEANLVLVCDVLEHVENDATLFEGIARGVRPGCQILITVPADPDLWTIHDVTHGHFRRYTRERLKELWEGDLSLELRLLSPFNRHLFPMVRAFRLLSRLRGKALGTGASDLFLPPRPINSFLRAIFFSEHRKLLAELDVSQAPGRGKGVSWIAVLGKVSSVRDSSGGFNG